MNWEALGAVGELVGALAVLITLVYLAHQIRQNTRAVRLESRNTLQQAFSHVASLMANSPDMAELFLKGCKDYRGLPLADRLRFSSVLQNLLFSIELQHMQFSEEVNEVSGMERIESLFKYPGVQDWWGQNKELFRPTFIGAVESVLAQAPRNESSAV